MPRTKSPERENERRTQLLIATFSVFTQKGFAQSTLEDIAAKAGFSKAVTLYYFKSKEDMLVATFQWLISDLLHNLQTATEGTTDAQIALRGQLEQLFISTRRNRRFYHVYLEFLARSVHNPRYGAITAHFYAGFATTVGQTIERGIHEGTFRPTLDAHEAVSMCGAIMDGLQIQWLFDAEETFGEYRERCWRGWMTLLGVECGRNA